MRSKERCFKIQCHFASNVVPADLQLKLTKLDTPLRALVLINTFISLCLGVLLTLDVS